MPWGVGARDVALTQGNALQGDLLQGSLCQWCRCLLYVDTAALGCAFLFCWAFYGPSYSGYIYICIMRIGATFIEFLVTFWFFFFFFSTNKNLKLYIRVFSCERKEEEWKRESIVMGCEVLIVVTAGVVSTSSLFTMCRSVMGMV